MFVTSDLIRICERIERQQQQRTRIGGSVPRTYCIRHRAISHENCVNRRAQKPLHQRGRIRISADEIAQRPDYRTIAELLSIFEQACSSRRESNAFTLQCLERIYFSLERCVSLLRAEKR